VSPGNLLLSTWKSMNADQFLRTTFLKQRSRQFQSVISEVSGADDQLG